MENKEKGLHREAWLACLHVVLPVKGGQHLLRRECGPRVPGRNHFKRSRDF